MKHKQIQGSIMLLITSFFWGTTFVAQQLGMDHMGPFTYLASRSFLGATVLIPVFLLMDQISGQSKEERRGAPRALGTAGVLCGLLLFLSSILQQIGIMYTTAGKCGFITALYIVIVPLLGLVLRRSSRVSGQVWGGVALATVGMYLLCMSGDSLALGKGDALVLLCAFSFSGHILLVSHFAPRVDGVRLSCIQFFVVGVISLVCALIFEQPSMEQVMAGWQSVVYAGILSSAVAYTLQILGQKHTPPTTASLIMSLESVFSVLASFVVLHERLTVRETMGCVLMFIAILLAQIPLKRRHRRPKTT